ncbi:MAG: hypothetical protein AB1714_29680 [Acidobacteriota bacterium]
MPASAGLLLMLMGPATSGGEGPRWEYIGPGGAYVDDVAIAASDPKTLYVVSDPSRLSYTSEPGTLFRSKDGGASWERISRLPFPYSCDDLEVDGALPRVLFILTDGELVRSTDGGRGWTTVLGKDTADPGGIFCFAADPARPAMLYAGARACVLRSTDRGGTWSRLDLGRTGPPRTVYVGCEDNRALWRSADGGWRWSRCELPGSGLTSLAASTGRPGTLYAGFWGLGVYRSADGGDTWHPMRSGLAGSLEKRVHEILLAPPSTIYLGADAGAFRAIESND